MDGKFVVIVIIIDLSSLEIQNATNSLDQGSLMEIFAVLCCLPE